MTSSGELVSIEQSTDLSSAIGSVQLEKSVYENDGSFECMLEGCARVDWLGVPCEDSSQFTAVTFVLQGLASVLRELIVHLGRYDGRGPLDEDWRTFCEQAVMHISASLSGNTHLRKFMIDCHHLPLKMDVSAVDKLLCDTSSIESISNSNHKLESILFGFRSRHTHSFAWECLKLNKNEDKAKVIHDKILRFYFVEEFDVSPFSNMALSVLPTIISHIKGNDRQTAICRLLRCMPELCNVSDHFF